MSGFATLLCAMAQSTPAAPPQQARISKSALRQLRSLNFAI